MRARVRDDLHLVQQKELLIAPSVLFVCLFVVVVFVCCCWMCVFYVCFFVFCFFLFFQGVGVICGGVCCVCYQECSAG